MDEDTFKDFSNVSPPVPPAHTYIHIGRYLSNKHVHKHNDDPWHKFKCLSQNVDTRILVFVIYTHKYHSFAQAKLGVDEK